VCILEQTAIIFLKKIKFFYFINDTEIVWWWLKFLPISFLVSFLQSE